MTFPSKAGRECQRDMPIGREMGNGDDVTTEQKILLPSALLLPDDSSHGKQQTPILTLLIKARVGPKYQEETEVAIQPLQQGWFSCFTCSSVQL